MELRKNPWVAAILNFIIPGLGYLFIGRKRIFAILLLLGMVFFALWIMSNSVVQKAFNDPYINISSILIMMGFGYDAYIECKKKYSD